MIWDNKVGNVIEFISKAHLASITSIALIEDKVWTSSLDKTIKIWIAKNLYKKTTVEQDRENRLNTDFSGVLNAKFGDKKSWKSRYIVLSKTKISIFSKQTKTEPKVQIFIDEISGLSNYEEPKKNFCFAFTAKAELYIIQANNSNDVDLWMSAIDIRRKENKRKPIKTLLESDRVTYILYDQEILWSANSNLILNLWDTKNFVRKKEKKVRISSYWSRFLCKCYAKAK